MKKITFERSDKLAGVASMLEYFGYEAQDRDIALGMEAPYLFVQDEGIWRAGSRLYHPEWINLYLEPRGFRMEEGVLPRDDVGAFLRSHCPVLMQMKLEKGILTPVVFKGYADGRYHFESIGWGKDGGFQALSLSVPMMKRRLHDEVLVCTLEPCEPHPVDFVPCLKATLDGLGQYRQEVMDACMQTVNRAAYQEMQTTLLRALMRDLRPMIQLIPDMMLSAELRCLEHYYGHVFMIDGPEEVSLEQCFTRRDIRKCLLWYRELVVDRLYALTGDDSWQDYAPMKK